MSTLPKLAITQGDPAGIGPEIIAAAFAAGEAARAVVVGSLEVMRKAAGAQFGLSVCRIEHLAEDDRGLQVIGQLHDDDFARLLARELENGRLAGLSFGYRVRAAQQGPIVREIKDLELLEVSLVRRPMQPLACIHKVAP